MSSLRERVFFKVHFFAKQTVVLVGKSLTKTFYQSSSTKP